MQVMGCGSQLGGYLSLPGRSNRQQQVQRPRSGNMLIHSLWSKEVAAKRSLVVLE